MWDVSEKKNTARSAIAAATLRMRPETVRAIRDGTAPKGDPLPVAKVAAIQAAKNTSSIVPYCHPLPITHVGVGFEVGEDFVTVTATVKTDYKTGVEMEALTAATVAALTIYDMLKMLDPGMAIERVALVEKRGGKSDFTRGAP